jgi:hypothetical protein
VWELLGGTRIKLKSEQAAALLRKIRKVRDLVAPIPHVDMQTLVFGVLFSKTPQNII